MELLKWEVERREKRVLLGDDEGVDGEYVGDGEEYEVAYWMWIVDGGGGGGGGWWWWLDEDDVDSICSFDHRWN